MKRLPWIPRLNRLHIHAAELGNSRGNISHLGKELAGALLSDQGIKNAEAQAPEMCTTAGFGYWRDYLLLAPEVGYVVFSASFGLCCSSLKWWPILSRTADQRRRFSLTSHKSLRFASTEILPRLRNSPALAVKLTSVKTSPFSPLSH